RRKEARREGNSDRARRSAALRRKWVGLRSRRSKPIQAAGPRKATGLQTTNRPCCVRVVAESQPNRPDPGFDRIRAAQDLPSLRRGQGGCGTAARAASERTYAEGSHQAGLNLSSGTPSISGNVASQKGGRGHGRQTISIGLLGR